MKMKNSKSTLRPPIQSPGLFHFMTCGLPTFDLKRDEYQAFEDEVQKLNNDPAFMDMLFVTCGRFYSPSHQLQALGFFHASISSLHNILQFVVTMINVV
jgi:hypothetical protein